MSFEEVPTVEQQRKLVKEMNDRIKRPCDDRLSLRIPEGLKTWLKDYSEETGTTVNRLVIVLLEKEKKRVNKKK